MQGLVMCGVTGLRKREQTWRTDGGRGGIEEIPLVPQLEQDAMKAKDVSDQEYM